MKYVLKGLEINVKGEMFSKGNLDANFKIEELELEGNFEEIYKEVLPVMLDIVKPAVNKEIKEEHGDVDGNVKSREHNIKIINEAFIGALTSPNCTTEIVLNSHIDVVYREASDVVTFRSSENIVKVPAKAEYLDIYIDDILAL